MFISHFLYPLIHQKTFGLDCVLTIVNNECYNEYGSADIPFEILILLPSDIYPGVEVLDHMAVLLLIFFEEPLYCFP